MCVVGILSSGYDKILPLKEHLALSSSSLEAGRMLIMGKQIIDFLG